MCGISGLILREKVQAKILEKMVSGLSSRGPDAMGTYIKDNMGLGHRRLKIIDLSDDANQPMSNAEQNVHIVFNGEIYNFPELKNDLQEIGHTFRTRSDTEVLLRAYEAWGEEAFIKLNGIFAFGILDQRRPRPLLYLVRDRFGAKPLFYANQSPGKIAFASTLKPLLEFDWVNRHIEPRTLFHYLQFSHVPTPDSILSGVRQLQPGTFLRFEDGTSTIGRYWDPIAISECTKERKSQKEWEHDLSETLDRVVQRQTVSDVPVGCFLSGGIDSSLLVSAFSKMSKTKINTYSIGYEEAEFDESKFARIVAKHFNTDHHELIVKASDFFELIPEIPQYFDQPFADPTLLPSLLLSRFARKDITVAFSGDGADELFFGYTYQQILFHLKNYEKALGPVWLRKSFAKLVETGLRKVSKSNLNLQRLGKFSEIFQYSDDAELYQYFVGTIGPMRVDRVAKLLRDPPTTDHPIFSKWVTKFADLPTHEKISQIFLNSFLVDTVLEKTDRASMAYGLEARVPFLDNEMIDFSSRLPFNFKYRHGTKKFLLRSLLGKTLPRTISSRKKQGFSIPMREWLKKDLKFLLDEQLNETRISRDGIFDRKEISKLVHEHLNGVANHAHLLWSLVSFNLWKEAYLP